jgi:hypothetical protein
MPTPNISGANQIEEWLGGWNDFHDFYLLAAPAPGASEGELRIHGWVTDWDKAAEGYYRQSDDGVVTVSFRGISSVELSEGELPAIILDLTFESSGIGWIVRWDSSYGPYGTIEASDVALSLA